MQLEFIVLPLDLPQHVVEGVNKVAEFILVLTHRAQPVVSLHRNSLRGSSKIQNRGGDDALQFRAERQRGQRSQQEDEDDDHRETHEPLMHFLQIRLQVQSPDLVVAQRDSMEEHEAVGFEAGAVGLDLGHARILRHVGAPVAGEQLTFGRVDARHPEVLFGAQRGQNFLCGALITEAQSRGAVGGDDFRQSRQVFLHGAAEYHQIIAGKCRAGEKQSQGHSNHGRDPQFAFYGELPVREKSGKPRAGKSRRALISRDLILRTLTHCHV